MPVIPATLRFGDGPPLQRRMLVDSGADVAGLSLDVALQLGIQPWQLRYGQVNQIDGVRAPVCMAPEGLTVEILGFAPLELPATVLEHRSRTPNPYETLGRLSLFGPLTVLFEESPSGPRVVFIEPGEAPFRLRFDAANGEGPSSGEGWASFPYVRAEPTGRGRPIVPVRLWWKSDRSVDVPMVVDTGAGLTVLPSAVAHDLGLPLWRMPNRPASRHDGSLYDTARGLGVTLDAQVDGLPPITLPFMVVEGAGKSGYQGNLACAGLLDKYRLVFHRQDGTDRVTFLDAERFPPSGQPMSLSQLIGVQAESRRGRAAGPGVAQAPTVPLWAFFRYAFRDGLAAPGPAESVDALASRLGLAGTRKLTLRPAELTFEVGRDTYDLWVCGENGERLLTLTADRDETERLTRYFRDLPRFRASEARPGWRADVAVFRVATRADPTSCRVAFFHLQRHFDALDLWSYSPSPWDCFSLLDAQDRLMFYTPTRILDGPPRSMAHDTVHLPDGEVLITHSPEPEGSRSATFRDAHGRRLATLRVNRSGRLEATLELEGPSSPVVPLFQSIFLVWWSGARTRAKRAHDFVARHTINPDKRPCPACGTVPEAFLEVRGGWTPHPGEPFVCRCKRVMVLDDHLAPRLPTAEERASWQPSKTEALKRAGAILEP